ncbi:MAG TPA: hypothetical protein VD999_00485 [Vitreimonas sp.]|nr:hypothetical protein [Vitreimonas sp.]
MSYCSVFGDEVAKLDKHATQLQSYLESQQTRALKAKDLEEFSEELYRFEDEIGSIDAAMFSRHSHLIEEWIEKVIMPSAKVVVSREVGTYNRVLSTNEKLEIKGYWPAGIHKVDGEVKWHPRADTTLKSTSFIRKLSFLVTRYDNHKILCPSLSEMVSLNVTRSDQLARLHDGTTSKVELECPELIRSNLINICDLKRFSAPQVKQLLQLLVDQVNQTELENLETISEVASIEHVNNFRLPRLITVGQGMVSGWPRLDHQIKIKNCSIVSLPSMENCFAHLFLDDVLRFEMPQTKTITGNVRLVSYVRTVVADSLVTIGGSLDCQVINDIKTFDAWFKSLRKIGSQFRVSITVSSFELAQELLARRRAGTLEFDGAVQVMTLEGSGTLYN